MVKREATAVIFAATIIPSAVIPFEMSKINTTAADIKQIDATMVQKY